MFLYEDLFEIQSNVGAILSNYIKENGITKSKLCKETSVSRPTLDKVLNGTIGSKANYERHIKKILDWLSLTPDMLLGKKSIKRNHLRALRTIQHTKLKNISKLTGISEKRLQEIEEGEEPTISELRDLALLLNTSTFFLMGENVFDEQVSMLNYFFVVDKDDFSYNSGFWGHVGILPMGCKEFYWFPITGNTRSQFYTELNSLSRMVIPCMNNKLLYLNMDHIRQIIFLDEACDTPEYANWDRGVDCGEIPPVIYEALEDYLFDDDELKDENMSPNFRKVLEGIIKEKNWDENHLWELRNIIIHEIDGNTISSSCAFKEESSLIDEIELINDFADDNFVENWLSFTDVGCEEIIINMKQIAMIELPLAQVEEVISRRREEE